MYMLLLIDVFRNIVPPFVHALFVYVYFLCSKIRRMNDCNIIFQMLLEQIFLVLTCLVLVKFLYDNVCIENILGRKLMLD